ncbi:zinc permease [Geobacter hydrogenophilus]|uniref:ZIP family metal transporter n=1 Tax=Geobacter hydrogenophilus TaxID=40983 RepID=UPI001BDA682C|nr:zinc permease [Geobacter hydrogenophilus]MBT0895511.1 zinc permease [Geobacter hydrogenophilus]
MSLHNLLLISIPAVVALCGGFLAAYWKPNHQSRSLIQHFAAGVVLAALAVELLPEIGREHAPGPVLIGAFALGSLFMYGLKFWAEHLEHQDQLAGIRGGIGRGLLLATFIDVAVDGFIIGAGFAAGGETGPILAIGLSVELLFLGLALTSDRVSDRQIVLVSGGLGVTVLLCAVLGNLLLAGASHTVIGAALAFSAAALLYLVTEELLMEAHVVQEKPISTLVLFAGFLIFWSIQLMGV